jgi:hypothetical protein
MNRILIFILFASQIAFGQSKILHEPERLFNKLNLDKSTTEFIKEHKIEKITFLRDNLLSSSIEFDRNGNSVCEIGMENNAVRKSLRKYNKQNREIETKYFSTDGSFRYGYYYEYKNGAQLMYKIGDSLLFRKRTSLKDENISTYSEYDKNGKIILKNVYVKDKDMNWLLETRFRNDKITVQYHFEYLNGKKYVTQVNFDEKGTKTGEIRRLREIKTKNKIEHYAINKERIFKIENFNKNGSLVKMELFDNDNKLYRLEINNYNSKGQLTKVIKENLQRVIKTEYIYNYDNQNRIERIDKITNGIKEIFRYKYKTF